MARAPVTAVTVSSSGGAGTPTAAATVAATRSSVVTLARSTNQTGPAPDSRWASSSASRLFPAPAGPVSVRIRVRPNS